MLPVINGNLYNGVPHKRYLKNICKYDTISCSTSKESFGKQHIRGSQNLTDPNWGWELLNDL